MNDILRVLLTNDDGVDAPGIVLLREAFLCRPNTEVVVVAPDRERSTCSHGMTLGKPVKVVKIKAGIFAVDGLPADCVFLALNVLLQTPPHLVVSGINRGANLGSDVIFSGTVAGARQAALMGLHGIAASLTAGSDFEIAARMTVDVAASLAKLPRSPSMVLNLNFPPGRPKGIQFGALGRRMYPQTAKATDAAQPGSMYFQLGGPDVRDALIPGSDGRLIANGFASATLLNCDQTDTLTMNSPFLTIEGIAPATQG